MFQDCDSIEQSEDDSLPCTDESEDSVDVKVKPISLPRSHHRAKISIPGPSKPRQSPPTASQPIDYSSQLVTTDLYHETIDLTQSKVYGNSKPQTDGGHSGKFSRRKTADPRKVKVKLASVKTDEDGKKRQCDNELDDHPSKHVKSEDKTPLDSSNQEMISGETFTNNTPLALNPLFLTAFHPIIGYPYSHLVNNLLTPQLELLSHGVHQMPYSFLPVITPYQNPVIASSIPATANPSQNNITITNTSSKKHSKRKGSIKLEEKTQLNKKTPENKLGEDIERESTNLKNVQERPIDYSIKNATSIVQPSCSTAIEVKNELSYNLLEECIAGGRQKQRNYKNMTRERRIEANARERTRVHTISAAFDKLRQSVPSYSNNQKLSKLSVLRIAGSYILSLSRLASLDYSIDESSPPFSECIDLTTRTIQTEGKSKKKRDNDLANELEKND